MVCVRWDNNRPRTLREEGSLYEDSEPVVTGAQEAQQYLNEDAAMSAEERERERQGEREREVCLCVCVCV